MKATFSNGTGTISVGFTSRKEARQFFRAIGFKGTHSENGDVLKNKIGHTVTIPNVRG